MLCPVHFFWHVHATMYRGYEIYNLNMHVQCKLHKRLTAAIDSVENESGLHLHRFVRTRQNIADAEHHSEGGLQRKIGAELIAGYTCFTLLGISQHKRREQRPLTASPLTRYEQRSAESGVQEPRSIFMCLLCFVSLREKQDQAVQGVRGASVVEMVVQQEPRPSRLRRN